MSRTHCQSPDACTAAKPTTHCRRCAALAINACPIARAKRSASMIARYQDEEFKAEQTARTARGIHRAARDPDWIKRKQEVGRQHGAANLLKGHTEESRRKAGARISATKLAHVPEHLRHEYRELSRRKGLTKAERIEVINGMMKAEQDATPEAEGRRIIERITREMHAKAAREKAQAY